MTPKPKSIRKTVTFDSSDGDQALLDAIETELYQKQYGSFGELCKVALHQFLLSREPTQSVILFIELERQTAALQSRVAQLEETGSQSTTKRLDDLGAQISTIDERLHQIEGEIEGGIVKVKNHEKESTSVPVPRPADPLLARLGPLLEDF